MNFRLLPVCRIVNVDLFLYCNEYNILPDSLFQYYIFQWTVNLMNGVKQLSDGNFDESGPM
jgi:hypothetical protein